jgi:hypothetical protein
LAGANVPAAFGPITGAQARAQTRALDLQRQRKGNSMARRSNNIPYSKLTATCVGAALCCTETWLNVEFIAQTEGWASSLVAAVAVASLGAATALPLAERAAKAGHWLKTGVFALFFVCMVAFSFTAGVERIGTKRDTETALARSGMRRSG